MTQISERTVLFADLRGSTALYESLGNARATTVVTQSVARLAQVVENCDGKVVKTLGDGLMAVFQRPGPAVQAADEMHESLERGLDSASSDASLAACVRFEVLRFADTQPQHPLGF